MGKHHTAAAALVVALGALAASACSTDDGDTASETFDAPTATVVPGPRDGDDSGASPDSEAAEAGDAAPGGVLVTPSRVDTSAQALAIEAGVRIGASDIRRAADDTLDSIRRNGARVRTADVSIGSERDDGTVDGGGYFRVSVAPERLDALIADLDATVGPVSGRTQNAADVTDQLVDLDIRIAVEREAIEQFRSLLRDATEFDDVVAVQRVISERTISLEQLLASERNLENRVAESTLTIELFHTPTPAADDPAVSDGDGIAHAFATGWDAFVGGLFAIGFVLAVAAPFVLSLLVGFGIVWFLGRRVVRRDRRDDGEHQASGNAAGSRSSDPRDGSDTPLTSGEELAAPTRDG